MIMRVSNVIRITDATDDMRQWLKKNLVLINPDYAKKSRMGFYVGNTPKTIDLVEEVGDELIVPYGALGMFPKSVTEHCVCFSEFAATQPIDYNADVSLYDYQEEAVQAMLDAKFGILQSAAGSGKTQMGIAMAVRSKCRTLWLCHTLDLVKQSKERAEKYIDKSLIGVISGGKVNIGKGITFATVQTMSKMDLTEYKDYWDCIITDEVHRVSGSPVAVTQYRKVLNSLSARHKYGLSATVHRADGMIKATYSLVGGIAYIVPDEAVADKIMSVGIQTVDTGVEIERDALNTDGTVNHTKLISYLCNHAHRNQLIANDIIENRGHSCLILSDRLEHLKFLMESLPADMRQDAVMINGKMTSKKGKADREQALNDMRDGRKRYLFATYSLAKEGLDIPCLDRLFMASPVSDYAVVTQSIGRIARTCDGKCEPVTYDYIDSISNLVRAFKKRRSAYLKNRCYMLEAK